jgi:hypothetical protein
VRPTVCDARQLDSPTHSNSNRDQLKKRTSIFSRLVMVLRPQLGLRFAQTMPLSRFFSRGVARVAKDLSGLRPPPSPGRLGGSREVLYSESATLATASARVTLTAGADVPRSAVRLSGGFPVGTSAFTTRVGLPRNGSEVTTRGRLLTGSGVSKRADLPVAAVSARLRCVGPAC